ncbi:MAG: helix-turn-helix domain-containing protein [Methylobacteriaceae bacterium]|nr:helix-turn-helix domain-containing protein [Methylobacteriaceae bacterium]
MTKHSIHPPCEGASARVKPDLTLPQRLAYPVNDFCTAIGIGRSKLYELRAQGKIKTIKIGGRTLIPASEGHRLIAEACK